MIVWIHCLNRGTADVRFGYHETLVNIVRAIPGRRWEAARKRWLIPADAVEAAAAAFIRAGCTVTVDGAVWSPRRRSTADRIELIVGLFEAVPDRLASPTHRALARVWHPDAGGDAALMRELNEAWTRMPRRAS
jgi:hypothetical protein